MAKRPGSRARVHEDSAAVEIFHSGREEWTKGPSLRKPRSGLGVVSVEDGGETVGGQSRLGVGGESRTRTTRIFAVGGMYGAAVHFAVPYVEVLHVETHRDGSLVVEGGARDEKAPLDARRRSARESHRALVVVAQGRIYAIGGAGATKTGSTDSMWSLPVLGDDGETLLPMTQQRSAAWRKEPPMPTPRASITSGSLGGEDRRGRRHEGFLASTLDPDPLQTVEVFDPATRTWSSAPSIGVVVAAAVALSSKQPEAAPEGHAQLWQCGCAERAVREGCGRGISRGRRVCANG